MPSKDRGIAVFPVLSETRSISGSTAGGLPRKAHGGLQNGSSWHWDLLKLMLTGYRVRRENPLYLSAVVVGRSDNLTNTLIIRIKKDSKEMRLV
jgi:hypothetical protein